MRIFLRFSVGLFRNKTERIQLDASSSTDELLDLVAQRLNKPSDSFTVSYSQQQIRVRVIRGWPLSHYNLRAGSTIVAELNDDAFTLPQDSMTNKLLSSVISDLNPMELSKIEEVNEDFKESMASSVLREQVELDDDGILRAYLDQELEIIVKEARKGNLDAIKTILSESSSLSDRPSLLAQANHYKSSSLLNDLAQNGWAAIHVAAFYQQPQVLTFLLSHNANPNLWTTDGWTPLQLAASKRALNIVKILLECPRTNVNEMSPKGTALHTAVRLDFGDIVKVLLENKANEFLKDDNGETPLEMADSEEMKAILHREDQKKKETIRINPFLPQLPPILKGSVYRQNTLYQMKPLFLVCNPFQGTLIRYDSQSQYPRHPKQLIPLTSIDQIKILPSSEISWLMSKNYCYFQVFHQSRLILGVRHDGIAKRWVKGIFEASTFTLANEARPLGERVDGKGAPVLVLDDGRGLVRDLEVEVRKKASTASPRKNGGSTLLRELSSRSQTKNVESPKHKQPLVKAFTMEPLRNPQHASRQQHHHQEHYSQIQQPPAIPVFQVPHPPPEQQQRNFRKRKPSQQQLKSSTNSKQQNTAQQPQKKQQHFQLKPRSTKTTTTTMISQVEQQPAAVKIKFSSFELLKQLGSHSTGKVFQARLKSTGQIFTLKALHKKSSQNRKHAKSQAQILGQFDHPFIVKLHHTFQTINNTYLCLDQCSRGDLSQLLAAVEVLSQHDAVSIIAQVMLAIEYLHTKNIVYRNLKPESILLCDDGYIKMADFGLSKQIEQKAQRSTFCGTLAYLSPEMLLKHEVGKHSDVYGIGCVLYEMLTGQPPYYDADTNRLQQNICQGRLKFKGVVSATAKQIILKFLQRDVNKRITISEAKKHVFFRDVDFNELLEKKQGSVSFPKRFGNESDDEDIVQIENPRPKFTDSDYPQTKAKVFPRIS